MASTSRRNFVMALAALSGPPTGQAMGGARAGDSVELAGQPARIVASSAPSTGRVFWVSNDGDDRHAGTQSQPFLTISHVINAAFGLQPGDTVVVKPGTYEEQIFMGEGGDAEIKGRYITLKSQVRHQARLRPPAGAYSTLNIATDYVQVEGFDVVGGEGHGIQCEGPYHHIRITDNYCHNSGGSGISCLYGEFYYIEFNICHHNCATNDFHTSGISVFRAINVTGNQYLWAYRVFVRGNICYSNLEVSVYGDHTDGNGIIIDDFHGNYRDGVPYPFRTLVENNLCYGNGGKGIQVYLSDHVTVRNNTCYHNNVDQLNAGTWRAEISNANSSNNRYSNNICIADSTSNRFNSAIGFKENGYVSQNVIWRNNLAFAGKAGGRAVDMADTAGNPSLASGAGFGNIFGQEPRFLMPGDGAHADFRLRSGSPAINAGTTVFGVGLVDLDGNPRMRGSTIDLGCYEHAS